MIQRLPPLVEWTIADDDGNATFRFQPVASTHERWGTLTCPLAPASAQWVLYASSANVIAGQELLPWNGNSVAGPILVTAMLTPVVTATGLVAGTVYKLLWHGYEGDLGEGEQAAPGTLMPSPAANTSMVVGPGGGPVVVTGVAGSGSLINYAQYSGTPGNPVSDWSQDFGNFDYLPDATNLSFPADSVSDVTVDFDVRNDVSPDVIQAVVLIRDSGDGTITPAGQDFTGGTGSAGELSAAASAIADTASAFAPFPWNVAAVETGGVGGDTKLKMTILSWAHP